MASPNEREGMFLTFYGRVGPRTYSPDTLPPEVEALERGGFVTMNYAGSYGNLFVEITDQGRNALGMPSLPSEGSPTPHTEGRET